MLQKYLTEWTQAVFGFPFSCKAQSKKGVLEDLSKDKKTAGTPCAIAIIVLKKKNNLFLWSHEKDKRRRVLKFQLQSGFMYSKLILKKWQENHLIVKDRKPVSKVRDHPTCMRLLRTLKKDIKSDQNYFHNFFEFAPCKSGYVVQKLTVFKTISVLSQSWVDRWGSKICGSRCCPLLTQS